LAAILTASPTSVVVAKVSPRPKVRLRLEMADLDLLPDPRSSRTGFAANQRDPRLSQLLLELLTPVGQVPKQLAGYLAPEVRLGQELFGKGEIRHVGGGELVRDGHTVLVAQMRGSFTP
jgi:hypothetical protein